jgi:hypothetical protein
MIYNLRQSILAFISAFALAVSFTACSSQDDPQPVDPDDNSGSYLELNIPMSADGTTSRAENGAESSENYAYGTDYENKINKVYLYFFDKDKKPVTLSDGKLYAEYEVKYIKGYDESEELPTGSSLKLSPRYTTGLHRLDVNLQLNQDYYLYVLCNIPVTTKYTTLDQFIDSELTGDYQTLGMPMSSRDSKGNAYTKFQVHEYNTESNPVSLTVYVERSLARIAYVDNRLGFTLYESLTSDKELGSVNLTGIVVFNTLTNWYTFRHVGDISASTFAPNMPADDTRLGQINLSGTTPFVIDPYTKNKSSSASKASSIYNRWLCNITTWHPSWTSADAISSYPQIDDNYGALLTYLPENSMHTNAQVKGQVTGVLIRAQLMPKQTVGVSKLTDNTYYYYDGVFYNNLEELKYAAGFADLDETNYVNYGVKRYLNGYGYFLYFIRHYDNENNHKMGPMEFSIVRNNSYDLSVLKVAVPPLTDDDLPNIDPTDPVEEYEDDDYIDIVLTVRPWIIREQGGDLK